jgi:hypothetical protein
MQVPINYLAVLVAGICNMIVGALWYGPVFGKWWMKQMNFTPESMKKMPLSGLQAMVIGFIFAILMSYVLANDILFGATYLNMYGALSGMTGAFWNWLGFVVPITAGVWLWEGKSWKLWAFNAGYYLVALLIAGAILGAWA